MHTNHLLALTHIGGGGHGGHGGGEGGGGGGGGGSYGGGTGFVGGEAMQTGAPVLNAQARGGGENWKFAVSMPLDTRPITMCCKVGRVSVGFVVSLLGVCVWYLVGLCQCYCVSTGRPSLVLPHAPLIEGSQSRHIAGLAVPLALLCAMCPSQYTKRHLPMTP